MRKIKLIALATVKDQDFRKALIGAVITGIGCTVIFNSGLDAGKKLGGERIIQIAEEMQPGFREAFKIFVRDCC